MKYSPVSDTPLPSLCKSILITLFILIFNSVASVAQTDILRKPLRLQLGNTTIEKALEAIEAQTGYEFSYSSNLIDTDRNITVSYTNTPLQQILQDILGDAARGVRVEGNQIRIQPSVGKGTITGTIRTSDGQPAGYVTVGIRGQRSTQADDQGRFTLENIEVGTYTISASYVGLRTQQQTVAVVADGTANVNFTLSEDAQTLQEVVVNGERVNKFADKETEYVARMPLSNLENPQVYNVINKELMTEQIAVDISDVMRNAVGVVPQIQGGGGFVANFRGFTTGVNARNGMETSSGRSSLDIANVERMEVIKGPSGTLFGSAISSFGGLVNLVTKKPHEIAQTEVSYTTGSFDLHRVAADVNAPLTQDKSVLFRVNAAVNHQNSFLPYGFNNTWIVAPSLTYKINERTTLNLDAEHFYTNNTRVIVNQVTAASGITNPRQVPLNYDEMLAFRDLDAETSSSKLFVDLRHQLSANWTSTSLFSFTGENVDHSYQYLQRWVSPTQVVRSVQLFGPISSNYLNVQQNVNGKFSTGFMKHNFLAGVNYRLNTGSRAQGDSGAIDTIDAGSPISPLMRKTVDNLMNISPRDVPKTQVFSIYATDVLNVTERLSALLSLRVDHFARATTEVTEGDNQTALAPKVGLVYQVLKDRVSVFGNYMSGFQNTASTVEQPDGTILDLNPVMAYQSEGGVKMESRDKRVNLTISYYHILIDNATRRDSDGFTVQDGRQVSKGADVEFIVNPLPGLNMMVGYAYNDNQVVKATDPSVEGNRASWIPENAANVWVSYLFPNKLSGFGLGVGGNYVDKTFFGADNVFYSPSYTLINSSVFYQRDNKWRLGIKLNNIANKKNWSPIGVPQPLRNFAVNLSVKF